VEFALLLLQNAPSSLVDSISHLHDVSMAIVSRLVQQWNAEIERRKDSR
jgi:hypothetical protein